MRLFADYHTHTYYSHGTGSIIDNARVALRRGLTEVAVADHGPANLFGVGVSDLEVFGVIRKDVEEANAQLPGIRVLIAVEANVIGKEGELDIPLSMQGDFDLVLAGLHILVRPNSWWHAAGVVTKNVLARTCGLGKREALVTNTDLLLKAVHRNRIDIITHPGYRLPVDTVELAKACVANQTVMEINTGHSHTDLAYVRSAAETGVRFAIGSDAHEPGRVGDLAKGLKLAKKAGLEPERIVNAVSPGRETGNRDGIPCMWSWRRKRSPRKP